MTRLILLALLGCVLLAGCGGQPAQAPDKSEKKPPQTKALAKTEESTTDPETTAQKQSNKVAENGPDPSMPKTITEADIRPLSDEEVATLTNCQASQVYSALGQSKGDAYLDDVTDRLIKDIESEVESEESLDMTLQSYMWNDGYRCPGFINKK